MKNLLYISASLMLLLVLASSCVREEDDIFDRSTAERINSSITEYKEILANAPKGWLMEYYAGKSTARDGGYNLFCSFGKNGEVTVASELEPGEEFTSLFDVIAEQSVVLSFSTYNPLMHYFSQPLNSPTSYFGDFEFVFHEVSDSKIVLKGKKWGNRIVMTRYERNESWQEYIDEINAVINATTVFSNFKVYNGATEIGEVAVDENRAYTFTFSDPAANSFAENAIYTTTGIKFYNPIVLGDKTVENFVWDNAAMAYICTDDGATGLKLEAYVDPSYIFYNEFIGTYRLQYGTASGNADVTATIEPLVQDKSFLIRGFGPFDVIAQYNRSSGSFAITGQIVGTSGSNNIWLCGWDSVAGYLVASGSVGMATVKDLTYDGIKFKFEDNGAWGTYIVRSYIVWLYSEDMTSGGQFGTLPNRFVEPFMTKQ